MKSHRNIVLLLILLVCGCRDQSPDVIEASGVIEGIEVNVSTEVAGRIETVRVQEGSKVGVGDTLLEIDPRDYRIQLRHAEAGLKTAESQYRLAVEGSRTEDIALAEVNLKNAERDFARVRELFAVQSATQKQLDDAEVRYLAAEQTYRKVKDGLRSEEITAAKSRFDQAKTEVEYMRSRLEKCIIVSPMTGIITLKGVEPGEFVSTGSRLLQITRSEEISLTIYINETDLGRIAINQRTTIRIDGQPDRTFEGRIAYISPTAEFTPKNVQTKDERTKLVFAVKIDAKNAEGFLKPGLPADATIDVSPQTGQ